MRCVRATVENNLISTNVAERAVALRSIAFGREVPEFQLAICDISSANYSFPRGTYHTLKHGNQSR